MPIEVVWDDEPSGIISNSGRGSDSANKLCYHSNVLQYAEHLVKNESQSTRRNRGNGT